MDDSALGDVTTTLPGRAAAIALIRRPAESPLLPGRPDSHAERQTGATASHGRGSRVERVVVTAGDRRIVPPLNGGC
jgi:hypothetical protein